MPCPLADMHWARILGSAGSDEVRFLKRSFLPFDLSLDFRSEGEVRGFPEGLVRLMGGWLWKGKTGGYSHMLDVSLSLYCGTGTEGFIYLRKVSLASWGLKMGWRTFVELSQETPFCWQEPLSYGAIGLLEIPPLDSKERIRYTKIHRHVYKRKVGR